MNSKYGIAVVLGLLSTTMAHADPHASSVWPEWCNFSRSYSSGCSEIYDRKPFPSLFESILCGGADIYDRKPMLLVPAFSSCGGPGNYDRKPMPPISPASACTPAVGKFGPDKR